MDRVISGGCVWLVRRLRGQEAGDYGGLLPLDHWPRPHRDDQLQDREQRLQALDPGQL